MKRLWSLAVVAMVAGCATRGGLKYDGGPQSRVAPGGTFAVIIRSQDGLRLSEATTAAVRDDVVKHLMHSGVFSAVDDGSPAHRVEITITNLSKPPVLARGIAATWGEGTGVKGNVQVKDSSGKVLRSFRAGADTTLGSFPATTRAFAEQVAKGVTDAKP